MDSTIADDAIMILMDAKEQRKYFEDMCRALDYAIDAVKEKAAREGLLERE